MSVDKQDVWAVVELMGHVKLAGRLSEEEKFGAKMGRLDIPKQPAPDCFVCRGSGQVSVNESGPSLVCSLCSGFVTQFFGGGSVYRITIVSEEVARHVAKGHTPQPVSPWDFPKQLTTTPGADMYGQGEGEDDRDENYDDE